MPAHNAEKTVVGAIRSTLAAMEPGDFFILLDDGSTDSTNDLAHSVGDPRLRVIRSATKSGISSALNRGIEAAETELIARMDADDICLPWRFKLQRMWMSKTSADFVFSNCFVLFENRMKLLVPNVLARATNAQLARLMMLTNPFIHPTALFRRTVFNKLGGYKPVPNEDFDLWQRAILGGYKLERFGIPTIIFRRHSGQVTQSKEWSTQIQIRATRPDEAGLVKISANAKLGFWHSNLELPTLLSRGT